jgi:hypothetical protein
MFILNQLFSQSYNKQTDYLSPTAIVQVECLTIVLCGSVFSELDHFLKNIFM